MVLHREVNRLTSRVSGKDVKFTTVVMPVLCWYTEIQPPTLPIHEAIMSRRQYTVKLRRPQSAVPLIEIVTDCLTMQEAIIRAEARTGLKHFTAFPS